MAPSPCEVAELDWSRSPAQAAVGQLLETAHLVDRLTVQLVEHLVRVVESGATDQALGVAVELVLSQSARMVRFERTALLRAATTLVRMPAVRQAFRDGLISWSQVRAIITAVGRVDVAGRDEVDALVGQLARAHVEFEADALVHEVDWLVAQLVEQRALDKESEPVESNRTVLAGRLDGSGTLFAELDADHFPWAAQAIDNRADDRFPFEAEPHPDDTDTAGMSDAELTAAHRHAWQVRGRNASRRAKAMFELLTGRDAATLAPLPAGDPTTAATTPGRPAVSLTCSVEALLDGSAPAWVLNRLGGRIQVTSATARKWLDVAGADARVFLFDDCGEVVGYGRRRRHVDGWLRDAIIARDLHDTAPGSTTPGPLCEVDHVQGWASGGATDAPNLTLLSRRFNNAKSRGDWQLTRHRDGTRTWTVPTTGYRIRQPSRPHLSRRPRLRPDTGPSP
ncbi:HNH endonuclease signature motif containing protein [Salsipaludibacter albus]|uniref:HNH endonuclease signature motif containing protein n=1 Tax=Salsipaludibacter albus TaxID=2849650 RepID=UPI001EE45661|nr:HNH endonuclease [Salsipaludibacter albus]